MRSVRLDSGTGKRCARIRVRLGKRQVVASGGQQESDPVEFSADASAKRGVLVIICVTRCIAGPRDLVMLGKTRRRSTCERVLRAVMSRFGVIHTMRDRDSRCGERRRDGQ